MSRHGRKTVPADSIFPWECRRPIFAGLPRRHRFETKCLGEVEMRAVVGKTVIGFDEPRPGAVHGDDYIRIERFEFGNDTAHIIIVSCKQMESPHDRMHLADSRNLHRLAHGIDNAHMTARRDDD